MILLEYTASSTIFPVSIDSVELGLFPCLAFHYFAVAKGYHPQSERNCPPSILTIQVGGYNLDLYWVATIKSNSINYTVLQLPKSAVLVVEQEGDN